MTAPRELAQTITLVFADGRHITACVPAFCQDGDKLAVTDIEISEPAPLPDGCRWEQNNTPIKGAA